MSNRIRPNRRSRRENRRTPILRGKTRKKFWLQYRRYLQKMDAMLAFGEYRRIMSYDYEHKSRFLCLLVKYHPELPERWQKLKAFL
jgi:hypothetical protein